MKFRNNSNNPRKVIVGRIYRVNFERFLGKVKVTEITSNSLWPYTGKVVTIEQIHPTYPTFIGKITRFNDREIVWK